jgi:hypothetical protein
LSSACQQQLFHVAHCSTSGSPRLPTPALHNSTAGQQQLDMLTHHNTPMSLFPPALAAAFAAVGCSQQQ